MLELNIGGPEAFGLGAYGLVCVGGNEVVLYMEGGLHAFERCVPVFSLVIVVREEHFGKIDRAAWDVNRLECVDERLVEAFDVVIVRRSDNGGEGAWASAKRSFAYLGVVMVLTARAMRRERSGERRD